MVSQMTSQMEENAHQLATLQEDLKKLNADVDFRLNELKNANVPAEPQKQEAVAEEKKEEKKEKPMDAKLHTMTHTIC